MICPLLQGQVYLRPIVVQSATCDPIDKNLGQNPCSKLLGFCAVWEQKVNFLASGYTMADLKAKMSTSTQFLRASVHFFPPAGDKMMFDQLCSDLAMRIHPCENNDLSPAAGGKCTFGPSLFKAQHARRLFLVFLRHFNLNPEICRFFRIK